MTRRHGLAAALALSGLVLTGCVGLIVPRGTSDPVVSPTRAIPGTSSDCTDGGIEIASSDAHVTLRGHCELVRIVADRVELEASAASIDTLVVTGSGNDVDAGDVGTLSIGGDDNEVDAADVGSVEIEGRGNDLDLGDVGAVVIRGDGNEVDASGGIGSVTVDGDDNDVSGATIGHVVDSGMRNEIGHD